MFNACFAVPYRQKILIELQLMTIKMTNQREYSLSDSDFEKISDLAYLYTGIVLGSEKKPLLLGRLTRRLRDLELDSVADYLTLINKEEKPEVANFIQTITTHTNSFFSESDHFEFLAKNVCPEWVNTKLETNKIRIWSAGCSTGEEPYSIAMTLKDNLSLDDWDCNILATDLDSKLIEKAKQGRYGLDSIKSLAPIKRSNWFLNDENYLDIVKVKPEFQELISFKCLNLLDNWSISKNYDIIFCRNVLSYFHDTIQTALLERFADTLKLGGYLVIAHSEKLNTQCQRFKSLGGSIYQKTN